MFFGKFGKLWAWTRDWMAVAKTTDRSKNSFFDSSRFLDILVHLDALCPNSRHRTQDLFQGVDKAYQAPAFSFRNDQFPGDHGRSIFGYFPENFIICMGLSDLLPDPFPLPFVIAEVALDFIYPAVYQQLNRSKILFYEISGLIKNELPPKN